MTLKSCSRSFHNGITLTFIVMGAAIGIYGYLGYTAHMDHDAPHFVHSVVLSTLVTGIVFFVLNVIGLLGSIFQNKCLLIVYATMVTLVVILEVATAVEGFSVTHEEKLDERLRASIPYYNEEKDVKKFWDLIHTNFNCCGIVSVDDWGDNIPISCCKDLDANDVCHKHLASEASCATLLVTMYRSYVPYGVGIVCTFQMISVIIAITMCFYRPETV